MNWYTCKCIAPGCSMIFKVGANTKMEAVDKVMVLGDKHNFDTHPEMPYVDEEKIRQFISRSLGKS